MSKLHVKVEAIGLPALTSLWGPSAGVDLDGPTYESLVEALTSRYGHRVRTLLCDGSGAPDPEILVVVNGGEVLAAESLGRLRLRHQDRIKLIVMAGGG